MDQLGGNNMNYVQVKYYTTSLRLKFETRHKLKKAFIVRKVNQREALAK